MKKDTNNLNQCETTIIHEEDVKRVSAKMPDDEHIRDLAELYKAFADSTRLKILTALSISELCVCDIAAILEMSSSAVSHQLRVLRQAKLIRDRRDGKVVYYALDDNHVTSILLQGKEHIREAK